MAWRKWLVRGVVFTLFGGLGAAAWLYERWTNPEAVRQAVVDKLGAQMPGAVVSLDSARLRLLGGIAIRDLQLARRDDPSKTVFALVPSAVIYHDKEQLVDGKLAIRKVELYRPRLRLMRRRDGSWNVADLVGPSDLNVPVPTIVIQQGTLLLEDQGCPEQRPVEIRDVNLTLINDPLSQVVFKGRGLSDLSGPVVIAGTWQRKDDALNLTVSAPRIALRPCLFQCLAGMAPTLCEHVQHVEGTVALQTTLSYQPGSPHPWAHDLRLTLHNGKINHPRLPLPLEHVEADLRCRGGELRLEKLTADNGATEVELSGWAHVPDTTATTCRSPRAAAPPPCSTPSDDVDLGGTLVLKHLSLGPEFFAKMPAKQQKHNEEYAFCGPVNGTCDFRRQQGLWTAHLSVLPENMAVSFWKFPYPIERITGVVNHEIDESRHVDLLRLDVTGFAGAHQVWVKGYVNGEGSQPEVDIKIWGNDLPIDGRLRAALPVKYQRLVKLDDPALSMPAPVSPCRDKAAPAFHFAGSLDFQAFVRRTAGAPDCDCQYVVKFHDTRLRYDVFPYLLEGVSGVLDVRQDHWEFRDFHATHKGADFYASGRSVPDGGEDHLKVDVRGRNVVLDSEMLAALQPELQKSWKMFNPVGRMNFRASVESADDRAPEVDVTITSLGCSAKPIFFPYLLTDVTGTFRYARNWVQLQGMRACHGATVLTIDKADAYVKPEGGYWADLEFLHGSPIQADEDLFRAVPKPLADACRELHLKDPFTLKTHLTVDAGPDETKLPVIFWDGELAMQNASLLSGAPVEKLTGKLACRGRYDGDKLERMVGNLMVEEATILKQPFKAIQGQIEVPKETPDVLVFPGLRAQIYGGEVYGPARVEFGSSLKYELNLTASQIHLEEFSRHNLSPGAPVSGNAEVRLYLTGQGSDRQSMRGRGSVDVPDGRLYNLPVLLDLLKFLGLRLPDRTAFEEAHASCTITGERVFITRLDLFGTSVSLRGQGEMRLDGSAIDLEFYAVWSRIMELLPPIIKDLPPAVSKHLLKIKIKGKMGEVRCMKEPVPDLVEPVRGLLEALARRRGQAGTQ